MARRTRTAVLDLALRIELRTRRHPPPHAIASQSSSIHKTPSKTSMISEGGGDVDLHGLAGHVRCTPYPPPKLTTETLTKKKTLFRGRASP